MKKNKTNSGICTVHSAMLTPYFYKFEMTKLEKDRPWFGPQTRVPNPLLASSVTLSKLLLSFDFSPVEGK